MEKPKFPSSKINEEVNIVVTFVTTFHEKFNVGIGIRSQEEMYFRCSLLFEELSELAFALDQRTNLAEELADVYYVLVGNMISMGYDFNNNEIEVDIKSFLQLQYFCGLIAKSVRRKWDLMDNEFASYFIFLHDQAICCLYSFAKNNGITDLLHHVQRKHEINLSRKVKKIGNTEVISKW